MSAHGHEHLAGNTLQPAMATFLFADTALRTDVLKVARISTSPVTTSSLIAGAASTSIPDNESRSLYITLYNRGASSTEGTLPSSQVHHMESRADEPLQSGAHLLCTTCTPSLAASRSIVTGTLTPKQAIRAPASAATFISLWLGGPTDAAMTLNSIRPVFKASRDEVNASNDPSTSACSNSGTDGRKILQQRIQRCKITCNSSMRLH